jgi:hypothetical protein
MLTVRYTADGGTYRVAGHSFEPGDEKDVDDELAGYLADHEDFEVLEDDGADDDAVREEDVNEEPVAEPPLDPGEHTVGELEDALQEGDYSATELDAIADAEAAGQDRVGAHDAVDAAREG